MNQAQPGGDSVQTGGASDATGGAGGESGLAGPWKCTHCSRDFPAQPAAISGAGELKRCPFCGCRDLYRQRDFNRKLGIAIIALGVLIGLLSRSFLILFIMLNVVALIDFIIYRLVPEVVVCYHCQAVMRGYPGAENVAPFDLNISDKYLEIERRRGW